MNTRTAHHATAYAHAQANADLARHPRYLHFYRGTFWIDSALIEGSEVIDPRQHEERNDKSPA